MIVPHHSHEPQGNAVRDQAARFEPRSLRTWTPTQTVIARSAGPYHWTSDGRRLYDYTSGVLVANLGHNPTRWMERFNQHMGWKATSANGQAPPPGYFLALPMTAYNAVTGLEVEASRRLVEVMRQRPGGTHMEQVMWAASGSEAVQKVLWAALARDRSREMILATRYGFHGKKGLACAVTGSETDRERDPRVKFIRFPMCECFDIDLRDQPFDVAPYRQELEALWAQYGRRFTALITEPYLGGGGSYHPPKAYLRMLQAFCREHDLVFILDEVQANFGRTGDLFAYETYGLEPDAVVLGKGLGNGVPVAAVVGRAELFATLAHGEASDTWSANPLCCAAVLATLEAFTETDILGPARGVSAIIEAGLVRLKELPMIAAVRGERHGMVWGIETRDHAGRPASDWADDLVLAAYRGQPGGDGIHLLGALAKKVVRVSPPLTITEEQAKASVDLLVESMHGLGAGAHAVAGRNS